MNERPCGMIRIAKLRWPRSESISHLVTPADVINASRNDLILCSFLSGRDACILSESKRITRNSIAVIGPSVFSSDKGTPLSLNTLLRVSRTLV